MSTLVLVRTAGQAAPPVALELVGLARRIGQGPVEVGLVGSGDPALDSLADRGVARVWLALDERLADDQPELLTAAAEQVARQASAEIVLLPADAFGRDVAPRLAHRLGAGLVTDAVGATVEAGLAFQRPVYGGKAIATMRVATPVAMATVRPRTQDPAPADQLGSPEVSRLTLALDASQARSRRVDRQRSESEGVRLEDATIVVSGGRGLGGAENFKLLAELAGLLGAALGASRAAVDEGWVPAAWQVGQTGKTVAPDLYIAVGISGASQHVAGMSGSKTIVAVNTDPEAPIFERAHLGVVGDYKEVIPALTAEVRKLLGK